MTSQNPGPSENVQKSTRLVSYFLIIVIKRLFVRNFFGLFLKIYDIFRVTRLFNKPQVVT